MVFRTQMEKANKDKLEKEFSSLLKSIFRHPGEESFILNVFIMTEKNSLDACKRSVVKTLSLMISEQVIHGRDPIEIMSMKFRFVDIAEVITDNQENIDAMKEHFGFTSNQNQEPQAMVDSNGRNYEVVFYNKYNHDLFYLLPFIADYLPVDKVIQLDLDLVFRVPITSLWVLFSDFSPSNLGKLS